MEQKRQSRQAEFQDDIDQIVEMFGQTDGELTAVLHQAITQYATKRFCGDEPTANVPDEMHPYLDKVALHAYKVTDADVAKLQKVGYSEDAIFEMTIGGSLGASLATWQTGIGLIDAFFAAEEVKDAA